LYKTPCAGCNNSETKEGCFFEKRICVDNIFLNKANIISNLKKFFIYDKKIINYSNYKKFLSDWTMPYSYSQLYSITNNLNSIKLENKIYAKFIFFFYDYIKFLVKNNLAMFFFSKIISRFLNRFLKLVKD
jgi:hypothetical protein